MVDRPGLWISIPERSGVLRYFVRENDQIHWGDAKQELIDQFPEYSADDILSVTFIPASLDDNPTLLIKDPGYRGRLKAQPRVERERLEKGNWKATAGSVIDPAWLRTYVLAGDNIQLHYGRELHQINASQCRRFATLDTAGTSKEKAATLRGDQPSWSVCAIWDWYHKLDLLLLRFVWRAQVGWNELKVRVPDVLDTWNVSKAYIENAHYGQPLSQEIRGRSVELIGPVLPGMDDSSRGAKLERAIASGLLSRLEDGKLFIPDGNESWIQIYKRELSVWTGLPKEPADQIDVSSYASFVSRKQASSWGGVISTRKS